MSSSNTCVAVKIEPTDSGRKKRKHLEPIDLTNCLKDVTYGVNTPGAVDKKTSLFFNAVGS